MKWNHNTLVQIIFTFGVILRVSLCWVNPPTNAFDDHFEPVFIIMDTGTIPVKNACHQCYHPPAFYWISASTGIIALNMGVNPVHIVKILQFIPCIYGVLTLGVIYLILAKLPLSDFSRLIAFCTVCFLPRHIYMSAMFSNDTISYLFVSLTIYLLLISIERKMPFIVVILTSIVTSITLFTKYTSYVVLPVTVIVFILINHRQIVTDKRNLFTSFILLVIFPITILSIHFIFNTKHYGHPLPDNFSFPISSPDNSVKLNISDIQPHDKKRVDFTTFKPWESISSLIIVPGQMHSFWTLIYTGMWFDNIPKFIYYQDTNLEWWSHYYSWLRGETYFPGINPSISNLTKFLGGGLILLGLCPLLLMMNGFYIYLRDYLIVWTKANGTDIVKMSIFPVLLFANSAGIIALTLRLPVYSAMKATYFLNSLPVFAVFLGLGLMPFEKNSVLKWAISFVYCVLCILVCLHILHICWSIAT